MGRTLLSLVVFVLLGSGCVPIRKNGTTHYLVVGVGVVSVNNTNRDLAQVVRANALGVLVSNRGMTAGYSAETSVSVRTNDNIAVEVSQSPFKSLNVCVPSSSPSSPQ